MRNGMNVTGVARLSLLMLGVLIGSCSISCKTAADPSYLDAMGNPTGVPLERVPEENEDDQYYWGEHSRLLGAISPAQLCEWAQLPSLNREQKAETIASLFGTYVKPGFCVEDMAEVIVDPNWLKECKLERVGGGSGRPFPGQKRGHSSFILRLFPDEELYSEWFIILNVKGDFDAGVMEDFIRGRKSGNREIQLAEFSLMYPLIKKTRITERFTRDGVGLMVE